MLFGEIAPELSIKALLPQLAACIYNGAPLSIGIEVLVIMRRPGRFGCVDIFMIKFEYVI